MKIDWKYGLGEIFIVIIGITLAFWLNNWADNLSSKKLRDQYLESLKLDLVEERNQIDSLQISSLSSISEIRQLKP